ncbi:DUF5610 domain-containing protein [Algibacillus agarilyticus]|uniref:DUF5610 domain-containing protein n=1 Tax=Algibacillus agarilyticus TaxID=2234133 RepID=UPI000DD075C9|nr:DUF5610 domain-containing protein [Algibacillus agarilyticus]
MNVGAINESSNKQATPVDVTKSQTTTDNTESTSAIVKSESHAVETHLSSTSFQQTSIKILTQSMQEHLHKMGELRNQFVAPEETSDIQQLKDLDIKKAIAESKPLFDFEDVAKNVLNFVGGALTGAAKGGAKTEQLLQMLGEARKGVEKGIGDARKILGDSILPGGEIDEGIKKTNGLINFGFDRFEQQINDPDYNGAYRYEAVGYQESIEISSEKTGNIEIQTNDGDVVTINFESLRAYNEKRKEEQTSEENAEGNLYTRSKEHSIENYHNDKFAFSVEGELDEAELKAVGDLINNISSLADEFYNGDVTAAYEKATELGFDQKEISNYAIELEMTNKVKVQQAYKQIAGMSEVAKEDKDMPKSIGQPIKEYAQKLIEIMQSSEHSLKSEDELQTTIQALLGQQYQLSSQDLFSALDKFNHFNQVLLNGEKAEAVQKNKGIKDEIKEEVKEA